MKILVIEDQSSLREEILLSLEFLDFETIGAENGLVGVKLAQEHLPDLIICDIMMPELDGYGVLAAMRQEPETARIPFIFLSAKADRSDIRYGMNLGAEDYLTKPFTIDELSKTINARLAKYAAITQPYLTQIKEFEKKVDSLVHEKKAQIGEALLLAESKQNPSLQAVLEPEFRQALLQHEFEVYYQPQVSLHTGKILGVEALARWQHPKKGIISPGEFIPLAEKTGLIIPLGEWVLRTACTQLKSWHSMGFTTLKMAVNLSARQFSQPNLSGKVAAILAETKVSPHCLELELTESLLVQDPVTAQKILEQLKAIGVQISIDDFGIGYSSLSYLKQFSFDTLKIDQCFVQDVMNDETNAAITTAIIQMARTLKLKVIGEGVETKAELDFLSQNHCDAIQGYLFSRPLPEEEFEKLLVSGKTLRVNG